MAFVPAGLVFFKLFFDYILSIAFTLRKEVTCRRLQEADNVIALHGHGTSTELIVCKILPGYPVIAFHWLLPMLLLLRDPHVPPLLDVPPLPVRTTDLYIIDV